MTATPRPLRRLARAGVLAGALALVVSGCAQKYSAERDGRDLGESICDLYEADSAEAASAALDDVQSQLDELSENYATFTAEDRADIDENLEDLRSHVADGDQALVQQDIAVIRRSLSNISDDVGETTEAASDGVLQGLDSCVGA